MNPETVDITITTVGEARRVVVDGQDYVPMHTAYQWAASARTDERKKVVGDIRGRAAQTANSDVWRTLMQMADLLEVDRG